MVESRCNDPNHPWSLKHGGSATAQTCMVVTVTGLFLFIDDGITEGHRRTNCEAPWKHLICSPPSNASKLQLEKDSRHSVKEFYRVWKVECARLAKSHHPTWIQQNMHFTCWQKDPEKWNHLWRIKFRKQMTTRFKKINQHTQEALRLSLRKTDIDNNLLLIVTMLFLFSKLLFSANLLLQQKSHPCEEIITIFRISPFYSIFFEMH